MTAKPPPPPSEGLRAFLENERVQDMGSAIGKAFSLFEEAVKDPKGFFDPKRDEEEAAAEARPPVVEGKGASIVRVTVEAETRTHDESKKRFCDECGESMKPTAKFCSVCGKRA